MERMTLWRARWKSACLALWFLVLLGYFAWTLPLGTPPVETINIKLPAGYEQNSKEAQALLAKKWLDGGDRFEISSEAFMAMSFQTTYVFVAPTADGRVRVTYLGAGGPSLFYTTEVKEWGGLRFYLVKSVVIQGNSVVIQTYSNWAIWVITAFLVATLISLIIWLLHEVVKRAFLRG
ncbi:MAG: hypothetical protein ACOZBZ_03200 [Patescibacteria group bacterium]